MSKSAAVALFALLLTGCGPAHYYIIDDVQTQRRYLTTEINRDGPAIRFKDELSGDTVKVVGYKIQAVSREAYEDAKRTGAAP